MHLDLSSSHMAKVQGYIKTIVVCKKHKDFLYM